MRDCSWDSSLQKVSTPWRHVLQKLRLCRKRRETNMRAKNAFRQKRNAERVLNAKRRKKENARLGPQGTLDRRLRRDQEALERIAQQLRIAPGAVVDFQRAQMQATRFF